MSTRQQNKYHKGTPQYLRKIGKSCEFAKVLSLPSRLKSRAPHYPKQRHILSTEDLILPMCLRFQQDSSFSHLRQYYPEHLRSQARTYLVHLFCRTAATGCFSKFTSFITKAINYVFNVGDITLCLFYRIFIVSLSVDEGV